MQNKLLKAIIYSFVATLILVTYSCDEMEAAYENILYACAKEDLNAGISKALRIYLHGSSRAGQGRRLWEGVTN